MPHVGRPPLGRSPSTLPPGRGPPYPLACQPSSASTGSLSARQAASANINRHFANAAASGNLGHPAAGLSSSPSPDPTQQPDQAFQRLHISEMLPSYMHRSSDSWPTTSAAPAPLASRRSAEAQHASGAMPSQYSDHTEPSLRDLATPPGIAPSAVRHTPSIVPTLPASGSLPGLLPRLGGSMNDSPSFAVGGGGLRGSRAQSREREDSQAHYTSSSLPAASSAATWVHSQSAQQLTANVKQLAAQVGCCCFGPCDCCLIACWGIT